MRGWLLLVAILHVVPTPTPDPFVWEKYIHYLLLRSLGLFALALTFSSDFDHMTLSSDFDQISSNSYFWDHSLHCYIDIDIFMKFWSHDIITRFWSYDILIRFWLDFHQTLTFEITRPLCIAAATTCKLTISAATTHADFFVIISCLFLVYYLLSYVRELDQSNMGSWSSRPRLTLICFVIFIYYHLLFIIVD